MYPNKQTLVFPNMQTIFLDNVNYKNFLKIVEKLFIKLQFYLSVGDSYGVNSYVDSGHLSYHPK